MRLYLVRHAAAASGDPDDLRPLTAAGRARARALGEELAALPQPPRAVVTSPLLRARETGAVIAAALGVAVEADERLGFGAIAHDVRQLAEEQGADTVAIAHQPDCSAIAAELGGVEHEFAPGDCVMVELP